MGGEFGEHGGGFEGGVRLVLGGFLFGRYAHGRIGFGAVSGTFGVYADSVRTRGCGQAWAKGETLVVKDVNAHPDHIACSSLSRSEIVVPLFSDDLCIGVLDVDSEHLAQFDETDALYLGELAKILAKRFKASRQAA